MHNQPRFTERQLRIIREALDNHIDGVEDVDTSEVEDLIDQIDEVLS